MFVGDLIDRGPGQIEVVDTVPRMVDDGAALVTMGNHEFNAIAWATPDGRGGYCRAHTAKNLRQHAAFPAAMDDGSPLHHDIVSWFRTIPLWLDLGGLRVVHACWDPQTMAVLGDGRLTGDLAMDPTGHGTIRFTITADGFELADATMPAGIKFLSHSGPSPCEGTCKPATCRITDREVLPTSNPANIRCLQQALATFWRGARGWTLPTDGRWTPATEDALRAVQRWAGLDVDGRAGPKTQAALVERPAPPTAGCPDVYSAGVTTLCYDGYVIELDNATFSVVSEQHGVNTGLMVGLDVQRRSCEADPVPTPYMLLVRVPMRILTHVFPNSPDVQGPGSHGPCVAELQQALTTAGAYRGPVNGRFDAATEAAVRSFQARHRLDVDGLVGPRTLAALGLPTNEFFAIGD